MNKLIIIGSEAPKLKDTTGYDLMVVNKAIRLYPHAKHHVSVHSQVLQGSTACFTHSCGVYCPWATTHWTYDNKGGSSALFGLHVALAMGYAPIILYGIPLTGEYGSEPARDCWKHFVSIHDCTHVYAQHGYTAAIFGSYPNL